MYTDGEKTEFDWDEGKNWLNQFKHGISFAEASKAFLDPHRVIADDPHHSHGERRHFCLGRLGAGVVTVRFTLRHGRIRIIGAGYWRKGREMYEKENRLH